MIFDDAQDPIAPGEARRGLILRGRVQGVGFRWWTRELAARHGVRGDVRNLPDGSVEIHVAGPGQAVEGFVERLRGGPRGARVDSIEEIPCRQELPDRFRIAF